MALRAYSNSEYALNTIAFVFNPASCILSNICKPSINGILMSVITMSGFNSHKSCKPSFPFSASPTRQNSSFVLDNSLIIPSRIRISSSTITTLISSTYLSTTIRHYNSIIKKRIKQIFHISKKGD